MTIQEMNQITKIQMHSGLNSMEKQVEMLRVLDPDLNKKEILELSLNEFEEKLITLDINNSATEILKTLSLDGYTLTLKGDNKNFDFSVGQMLAVHKAMKEDNAEYLHKVMAIVYQNPEIPFEERSKLFLFVDLEVAIPFLNILQKKYC